MIGDMTGRDKLQNSKILIVDDISQNLEVLGTVLREYGFHVAAAINGEQALAIARLRLPDLILLDVQMPGMDGFAVCRLLKEDETTRQIPIIFLTAKTQTDDIVQGFEAGAVDYINKPFQTAELLQRVLTHLELKKSRDIIAAQANNLKTGFLTQITHEIRTPLNYIMNNTELIEEEVKEKLGNDLDFAFSSIKNGCRRLNRTIELLLNYSLVQSGSYEPVFRQIDIVPLLTHVITAYTEEALVKGIQINSTSVAENTTITADEPSVRIILENLLDNAVKFTKAGKIETLLYFDSLKNLCLSIIDTGIGIREEYMDQIFQPLQQEDSGYTRKYDGNGLGLALSKMYMDMHKGEISVDSIKDKGSCFTLIFPHTADC